MLVDSHRLRFHTDPIVIVPTTSEPRNETVEAMPCPKRFAAALEETETTPDGVRMYTWRAVRRQQLRKLRKPVRWLVLLIALVELANVSSLFDLVYQGKYDTKAPGPEDYGIAHTAAYVLSWILISAFAILWDPVFSWWVPKPNDSEPPKREPSAKESNSTLYKLDMVILTLNIIVYLGTYIYHVVCTFVHVGPKPYSPTDSDKSLSLNTRKAWGIRALLLSGVCTSLACGKYTFTVLERCDLAKVKPLEYMIIVVPIQINIGILMATVVQFKSEKRQARKMAARKQDAEIAVVEEKQGLLLET